MGNQDLSATLEGWRDDIVGFAAELVGIPSENPPGAAYSECVEALVRRLERLGLPVERVPLAEGRVAVRSRVGDGPTLYLHGHYDVVPASTEGQFDPAIREGRLFGRGSADMKGALSSMLYAAAAVAEMDLGGAVELVFVPDEETGGRCGSGRLAELGLLDGSALGAVLGEPTSGTIWNGSRGAVTARVAVRGAPAHVGLHYEGRNAFEHAIPIVEALLALKEQVRREKTAFTIEPEEARESILMIGGETVGGHQFNLVPPEFSFSVERRFNPEEDLVEVRDRLVKTIREASPSGVDVDVDVFQEGASSATPEDGTLIERLQESVLHVTGRRTPCTLCPGLLETRFYSSLGIPAVAYGPGELEVSHGPDESVAIDRLMECAKIYGVLATRLLGRG